MAPQEPAYIMTVEIKIRGTTKKDAVRDAVIQQLQNAKTAGNIEEATWNITFTPTQEGGKV